MSGFAFALINAAPGTYRRHLAARWTGSPGGQERINENLGLDQPVLPLRQLAPGGGRRAAGLLHASGESVNAILAQRLPNTLVLFALSFFLAVVLALALGLWAGDSPGSRLDGGSPWPASWPNEVPSVLVAIGLIFLFSVQLGILPSSGTSSLFTGGGGGGHLVLLR